MFYAHKSITAESHLIFGCLSFGMSLDFEVLYFFFNFAQPGTKLSFTFIYRILLVHRSNTSVNFCFHPFRIS